MWSAATRWGSWMPMAVRYVDNVATSTRAPWRTWTPLYSCLLYSLGFSYSSVHLEGRLFWSGNGPHVATFFSRRKYFIGALVIRRISFLWPIHVSKFLVVGSMELNCNEVYLIYSILYSCRTCCWGSSDPVPERRCPHIHKQSQMAGEEPGATPGTDLI